MKTSATAISAALVVGAVLCLHAPSAAARFLEDKNACGCPDPITPQFQLLRGEDQVQQCEAGQYCDCWNGKRLGCVNVLGHGWKYNEDAQECVYEFDCKAFFDSQTTTVPTTSTIMTTARPTAAPKTSARPTTAPRTSARPTAAPMTTARPTAPPMTTARPTVVTRTSARPTATPTAAPSSSPPSYNGINTIVLLLCLLFCSSLITM